MQILEQEGLPEIKPDGRIGIAETPELQENIVFLRGSNKLENLCIAFRQFNTQYDLNAYLHWAVNAITDELFTGEGELKIGEMCEVSNSGVLYKKRKLVSILPKSYKNPFATEGESYDHNYCFLWQYARPLLRSIEPTINKNGNVVTYTWEDR